MKDSGVPYVLSMSILLLVESFQDWITVSARLIAARIIWKPEVENRKSEAKSTGGHMAKTKKQGENSACSALFERAYYSSGYGNEVGKMQ